MKRALFALLSLAIAATAFAAWHVSRHIAIGGTGGWDYVSIDSASRRAYVSHGDRVEVVDIDAGKVVGLIPDTLGVHGIAIDHDGGRGFISSGRVSMMSIFDLKTLNRINDVKTTGDNPDAILFDPHTKHVFTFNGRGKNASVFDTHGKVIATIDLGGKPEFGVSDGAGRVFVNIEDTSELVSIDAKKNVVTARWKLAPCESPSGLAIDRKHHRLFTVCENEMMAVVDSTNGHVVTTVPTGKGTDAAAFDDERQLAFASNGQSATLTVVHEASPDKYDVVDNVATQRSARTMALDTKSHHIFLPAAKFGDAPAPTEKNPRPRPPVVPGSFELIEVAP
ncbi:MAG TPA: YncE family protein [Thermoanaerobaculia bacterium]|jgi:DNA-binding beta-propeller fold protein YncE|nr:YncE family protein [Thermoanaerobaculia bacterium]